MFVYTFQVSKWLSAVFGDQTIPEYEVNTRTVDILYQLAEASEVRCNETSLLIEDQKQKTSEYQADGKVNIACTVKLSLSGNLND